MDRMDILYNFLIELDQLKSITRTAYIFDQSRNENSAEHSWHLAVAILMLKEELDIDIDMIKAVKMALVHDICEIGAGDISIYDPKRSKKKIKEQAYLKQLSAFPVAFASEIESLWEEYEAQATKESRWVNVVDRLMPFILNLATQGRSWKENSISKSQVKGIMNNVKTTAPEIYQWILAQIDRAVAQGWLTDD